MATYGSFLSDYHYEWFNRAKIIHFYAATNERLPQYETEAVLRARAAEFASISILTGWSFDSLDQSDHGVTVDIRETKGQAQRRLTARYLVGCDGARSPVREAAGITQTIDPPMTGSWRCSISGLHSRGTPRGEGCMSMP